MLHDYEIIMQEDGCRIVKHKIIKYSSSVVLGSGICGAHPTARINLFLEEIQSIRKRESTETETRSTAEAEYLFSGDPSCAAGRISNQLRLESEQLLRPCSRLG